MQYKRSMRLAGYTVLQKVTLGTFPFKIETESNISDSKAREHSLPTRLRVKDGGRVFCHGSVRPGTVASLFRTGFISTLITV